MEYIQLHYSVGRIGISEYFDYRLYQKDMSFSEKQTFCGYRGQAVLEEILVDERSGILSLDKVTMYLLMKAYGFPIPNMRAVYGLGKRKGPFRSLDSAEELAAYLREPGALPVYVKPSFGGFGRGNSLVLKHDGDRLVLGDGSQVAIGEYCQSLKSTADFGWILQEPLQAHPAITKLATEKVSGIRVHTFLSKKGPVITRAVWKINGGKSDTDNWHYGAGGNMIAEIDLNTGCVKRVITGVGFTEQINPRHPLTGVEFVGFEIPHWEALKNLVLEASFAFRGYICPGWDIAICEDGPKILEVNMFGDVLLSQHACGHGFIDAEFVELMRGLGLDHLLSGGSKKWQRQRNGRVGRRKAHWPY